jgi:hypothetical protein
MANLYILCLEKGWYLPNGCRKRIAQHFGGFFHKIKVSQQIGRREPPAREDWKKEEFFVFVAQSFKLFSKIQNLNKKLKTYSD